MPRFLPVPVSGQEVSGHGDVAKRYHVQIDGSEVSCQDEIVSVPSKKPTCRQAGKAPARRPAARRRLCPGRQNCRGAQRLIKGCEFSLIDFKD